MFTQGRVSTVVLDVEIKGYDINSQGAPISSESSQTAGGVFSVGSIQGGFLVTRTSDQLGITSLSLHADSTILASSSKENTFRSEVLGMDLVWKQIDAYGLPKHFSDFSLEVLDEMILSEIAAYQHLRAYWGILVPEFVYFGHDTASL
jgi:hypothetical protein